MYGFNPNSNIGESMSGVTFQSSLNDPINPSYGLVNIQRAL